MATLTKTIAETFGQKSTWTLTTSKQDETTSTNSLQDINLPNLSAKYSPISGKDGCSVDISAELYVDDTKVGSCRYTTTNNIKLAGNTAKSLAPQDMSFSASNIFNSQNPTDRSVPVLFKASNIGLVSGKYRSANSFDAPVGLCSIYDLTTFGTLFNIILDAPPTFGTPVLQKDTPSGYYAGLTTVSITVNDAVAQYGGDILSVTLNVNGQTKSISGQGTISMLLSIPGDNVIPTVTVTDSRGQTTTKPLAEINIQQYNIPSLSFDVYRVNSSGIKDDEGHCGLIEATINYTSGATHLVEPTVEINGTDVTDISGASTTWYSATPFSSSTEISDWSTVQSGATVYGLIDANYASSHIFAEDTSYEVTLTAEDTYNPSQPITQTLSTAFYTIDFQAGGKEIAFGAPANDTLTTHQEEVGLFKCGMEAQFKENVVIERLVGEIKAYAGNTIPSGWLECNGQAVSRTDYPLLWNAIGTQWGAGDGSTTFNVPNLNGRTLVGHDTSQTEFDVVGESGGAKTVTLGTTHIPAHTHGEKSLSGTFTIRRYINNSYGTIYAQSGIVTKSATSSSTSATTTGQNSTTAVHGDIMTINATHTHTSVGGGNAHNNLQPYAVVKYIICAV